MDPAPESSRRAVLAGATGALAATSGCIGELRNIAGRQPADQLSVRISTMPASDDPYAIRIANHLADTLGRSGVNAMVDPMSPDVLRRETLINHDFDIYVSRYPSGGDLDELRSMLYSAYSEEAGWQNPFGFSDLEIDELLDEQRTAGGDARLEVGQELQRRIVQQQPFTVVCFPDRIGAVRTDRFEGWPPDGLIDATDYFRLGRTGETTSLQLLLGDERITRNRNPIAVEHRDGGDLMGLLYDPLVRDTNGTGGSVRWLARSIEWTESGREATVRLRETPWHDGEPVTAEDVAFTYAFLKDTSLGEADTPVPTPLRRGRLSLVEDVQVRGEDRLRVEFRTSNRGLARRGLSVPILPEHVWRQRTEPADIAGIELADRTTEALVSPNTDAVGSGPFRFEAATADESLSLARFEEHFVYDDETEAAPLHVGSDRLFDRTEFTVSPSDNATVELLVENEADASADELRSSVVPRIVRADDVSLTIGSSPAFYHVGYNCRRSPMTNPRFRRIVSRHLDRAFVVEESLGGYGTPAEVPIRGRWTPRELAWDGEASLPFLGEDGELNDEAAREAFREAGYQYESDRLVRREGR